MSGKFWKGAWALFLVVFGVALTEYWKSEFVQGIINCVVNLPVTLMEPVGVELWLVIASSLFIVGTVLRVAWTVVRLKTGYIALPTKQTIATVAAHPPPNVTNEQKKVLAFLANSAAVDELVKVKIIHTSIGLSSLIVDNAVNELLGNGFVQIQRNHYLGSMVELSAKGKKYVVENGVHQGDGEWVFLDVK